MQQTMILTSIPAIKPFKVQAFFWNCFPDFRDNILPLFSGMTVHFPNEFELVRVETDKPMFKEDIQSEFEPKPIPIDMLLCSLVFFSTQQKNGQEFHEGLGVCGQTNLFRVQLPSGDLGWIEVGYKSRKWKYDLFLDKVLDSKMPAGRILFYLP